MWFKLKVNRNNIDELGREKSVIETYLTEGNDFADASFKVLENTDSLTAVGFECISMMKTWKPSANDYFEGAKIFMVKVAEDQIQEDGIVKTFKYSLPVFANDSNQVHEIMKSYIAQGLETMRLTTISETKWIYI